MGRAASPCWQPSMLGRGRGTELKRERIPLRYSCYLDLLIASVNSTPFQKKTLWTLPVPHKVEYIHFPYPSSQTELKTLDITYKPNIRRPGGWREKGTLAGKCSQRTAQQTQLNIACPTRHQDKQLEQNKHQHMPTVRRWRCWNYRMGILKQPWRNASVISYKDAGNKWK